MNSQWTQRDVINILMLSPLIQESQIATSVPTNIRNLVHLAGRNDQDALTNDRHSPQKAEPNTVSARLRAKWD